MIAADVGQPLVATLRQVGQLTVVQPEQLEDRRVQVVDVNGFFDGPESELVGGSDHLATTGLRRRPARW